jgi:type I restriction enzyme S subunit
VVSVALQSPAPGAKQGRDFLETELGLIPADWNVLPAKDVGVFRGGNGFPLSFQGKRSGEYPFFKVSDMNNPGNERMLVSANNYLSHADRNRLGAYVFPASTIVFAKVGAAIFLERKRLLGQPSCLDNNMAGFQITDPGVDVAYIQYYLQSIRFGDLVSTTALPALSGTALGSIKLPLPPTEQEQQAIAAVLLDADSLIEGLESLIAKKRAIKQGAMQELLSGRRRLAGFGGEWETRKFGAAAAIRNDKINTLGADIAALCVELEQIDQGTGQLLGYSDARSRASVKYRFQKGDVLFGRLRPYLRKYWPADRAGVCSTEIWPLIPKDTALIAAFLAQVVKTDAFVEAASSSYGTHMPRSDWKALAEYEIALPTDLGEQHAIAGVLSEMDEELEALTERLAKARQIKQGMMQELLTGRVRLV